MKTKPNPKKDLETLNKAAIAAVPKQDAATKAVEEGIAKHRAAIDKELKARDVNRKRKQAVALQGKI